MEISLTRKTELKFKLNISGAREVPKVRLCLSFEKYSILLPGTIMEGVATVKVPDLSFIKNEGFIMVAAKLEVVVNGQYRIPWRDNLNIAQEVEASASVIEQIPLEKDKTEVEVTAIISGNPVSENVEEEPIVEESISASIQEEEKPSEKLPEPIPENETEEKPLEIEPEKLTVPDIVESVPTPEPVVEKSKDRIVETVSDFKIPGTMDIIKKGEKILIIAD